MAPMEELHQAQVNRSIRTIKAELEYLCDSSIITPDQLSDLLSRVPAQTALHAPLSVGAVPPATQNVGTNIPAPTNSMQNLGLNHTRTNGSVSEKANNFYQPPSPQPQAQAQPPPAYSSPPPAAQWPPLAQATALYTYTSADAGDLELQPNDHITVTEYMNAEWWKGKSSRTGQEGIFPRSYVKVVEEKSANATPAPPPRNQSYGNNYGNQPLEVSQVGNGEGKVPSKGEEQGKKFGKKLGNAAIFGAGATLGGKVVNSIF